MREDYLRFAREIELFIRDIKEPDELRLHRAMPDIINRFNLNRKDIVRSVNRNYSFLKGIFKRLNDLFTGRVAISLYGPSPALSLKDNFRTRVLPVTSLSLFQMANLDSVIGS